MSPTLAEIIVLAVAFILLVWMGILLLPTLARLIYRAQTRVRQANQDAERELRGENTAHYDNPGGETNHNGKKQQG